MGMQCSQNEKANRWAQYDTGAASENICLQATALGLVAHQMGGFDAAAVREVLGVPSGFFPMAVIAVGYRGNSDHLHPDFRAAETGPRHRDELGTHFFLGRWGTGRPGVPRRSGTGNPLTDPDQGSPSGSWRQSSRYEIAGARRVLRGRIAGDPRLRWSRHGSGGRRRRDSVSLRRRRLVL